MSSHTVRLPTAHHSFGPIVIAIPVCNEAAHIAPCLVALASQIGRPADHIVLLVNNTTDRTVAMARSVTLPPGTKLHISEQVLPPELAHAGEARRRAMELAATLAGPAGVLLTTDADGQADRNWLAANLAALRAGADAVAGWVDLDPRDWGNIPRALHEDDARECAYDTLCDEIHARLDPDPADPWPRHTQNSGASIAVTAAFYHAVGGIPRVPCGEDRAFLAALRRADARIRHSPACHVTVSGRIEGRAAGGMADTIRRRLHRPDDHIDDRLEPARICARRAALRQRFRRFFIAPDDAARLAAASGLDRHSLLDLAAQNRFGAAWDILQRSSPVLIRQRVAVSELADQTRIAKRICAWLRRPATANLVAAYSDTAFAAGD